MLATFATVAPFSVGAQPEFVSLEPREDPALDDGRVAIVRGMADAEGKRYVLSDLSILQPVAVTVLSGAPDPALDIGLHLGNWDDAVRTATLDGGTLRTFRFRTQGSVGISVRAPAGQSQQFDLVAWVGSEVEPEMENAVVSPEQYTRYVAANPDLYPGGPPPVETGSKTQPLLLVIAALLAGIFVLLCIIVFRRART